jgi:hypothetical protein
MGLSAKSGPRVDFLRVQGPFCKISEIIFQLIISWTGSTRGGPGPGRAVHHGPTVAWTEGTKAQRCAHRSMASGHSSHGSSSAGAEQREGSTGNSARASLGLRCRCGDPTTTGKRRRRESLATAALVLREREKSEMGEVW